MNRLKFLFALTMIAVMTGCAGIKSNVYHSPTAQGAPLKPKVLFFPADVEVSVRNAGGDLELSAELSEKISKAYNSAALNLMFERGVQYIPYGTRGILDEHIDVLKEANTIMDSVELSQLARGGISSSRNFALSRDALEDLNQYGADYSIFSVLRVATASGGRTAVAALGAIAGVPVQTSDAQFRVAVFDLRDGQIKWGNFDPVALPDIGNLTNADEEDWEKIIEHMFSEFSL
jgi:hypothetical protein